MLNYILLYSKWFPFNFSFMFHLEDYIDILSSCVNMGASFTNFISGEYKE